MKPCFVVFKIVQKLLIFRRMCSEMLMNNHFSYFYIKDPFSTYICIVGK